MIRNQRGEPHYQLEVVALVGAACLVAGMALSSWARYIDGLDTYHFKHADGSTHTVTGRDLTVTYQPGQRLRHPPCSVTAPTN